MVFSSGHSGYLSIQLGRTISTDREVICPRKKSITPGNRNETVKQVLTFTLGVLWLSSIAVAADSRPNILFIMSDDHACNAISAYGGRLAKVAPTPNIDQIGRAHV